MHLLGIQKHDPMSTDNFFKGCNLHQNATNFINHLKKFTTLFWRLQQVNQFYWELPPPPLPQQAYSTECLLYYI